MIPARGLLFDQLLALHKIDEAKINGAQQMEFTHAAVAAYVASGMADASFGVEAAARQFGLDFVRLLTEDYFFVCKRAFLETEPMQRVLDIMKGREFHQEVASLPGYVATDTGMVQQCEGISGARGFGGCLKQSRCALGWSGDRQIFADERERLFVGGFGQPQRIAVALHQ